MIFLTEFQAQEKFFEHFDIAVAVHKPLLWISLVTVAT